MYNLNIIINGVSIMEKYLMWDFDYTLAYRDGMWTQTMLDVMKKLSITNFESKKIREVMRYGFPWNNYEISHKDLMGELEWWDYLKVYFIKSLIDLGLPADKATLVAAGIKDRYLDINFWRIFDDSLYALDTLSSKGYKHIILSNHVPELVSLVTQLKLDSYFEEIISSAIVGYEKPNKMIFNYAKKILPDNAKIIMIGDNYKADVLGANNNDIQAVLVRKPNNYNYGNYSKELDQNFIKLVEDIMWRI